MSSLSAIRLVAVRELKERGKSKPFLITSAITFLLVIAIIVVPGLIGNDTATYEVGSVGTGNEAIVQTAERLANIADEPDAPPTVEINLTSYDTTSDAEEGLLAGDVDLVLVDGTELIVERKDGFFGDSGPTGLIQQAAGALALEEAVAEGGQTAADVVEIISSETLEVRALVETEDEEGQTSVVAYFGLILLYMAIILYGTWILTGVTEEKSNRVVEVLISTIRPWQLLAGKIVGIGLLAMVQFVGTIAIAAVAANVFSSFDIPAIPLLSVLNLALWFILGFLLYAVMFGAAGSLVGRVEDAQSAALPMTMFSVIGFFAGFFVLGDPNGGVAVVTTFVPFTAPFTVPIRVSLEAIPAWQFALSLVIIVLTIYAAVRVAGRIYAGSILKAGARTKIKEAWSSADG